MGSIAYVLDFYLYCISIIYLFAFASLYHQIPGLYGPNGVLPAHLFMRVQGIRAKASGQDDAYPAMVAALTQVGLDPSTCLELLCLVGIVLAVMNIVIPPIRRSKASYLSLWILYFSVFQAGQVFLWFQWDILLLEAGFLTMFAAPHYFVFRAPAPTHIPAESPVFFWLLRWLLFRLMFASGVVKLTSLCPTWWSLTALNYHYETQCIPTPLAWWSHQLPEWFQRLSVVITYFIEIAVPFLFFLPVRNLRLFAFWCQMFLQVAIFLTGNYNFFNLLTMTLCLSLLDDEFFGKGKKKKVENTPGFFTRMSATLRPIFHPYASVAVYSLLLAYTIKFFRLRLKFPSPDSIFPIVDSQINFGQPDFLATLRSAIPFSVLMGVASLATEIYKATRGVASGKGSEEIERSGRDGGVDGRRRAARRQGTDVSVSRGMLRKSTRVFSIITILCHCFLAATLFSVSLVPHAVVDDRANHVVPSALRRLHSRTAPFHLASSYGLFRRMTGVEGRPEVVIEGTNEERVSEKTRWREIEFPYKPGNAMRRPPWVAPHQPRLDWQMWFAALGSYQHNQWFRNLMYRILINQPEVLDLLDRDSYPFLDKPPRYLRATLHRFRFTNSSHHEGRYWERFPDSPYYPIVDAKDPGLLQFLAKTGIINGPSGRVPDRYGLQAAVKAIRSILRPLDGFLMCLIPYVLSTTLAGMLEKNVRW